MFVCLHLLFFSYSGSVVPLDYRIDDDGTNCTRRFNTNSSSFRFAAQFQVFNVFFYLQGNFKVTEVQNDGASSVLFLLDKGRQFVTRWRDYLVGNAYNYNCVFIFQFSDFYDPFVNVSTAVPTFFIYSDVLKDTLKVCITLCRPNGVCRSLMITTPNRLTFCFIVRWMRRSTYRCSSFGFLQWDVLLEEAYGLL